MNAPGADYQPAVLLAQNSSSNIFPPLGRFYRASPPSSQIFERAVYVAAVAPRPCPTKRLPLLLLPRLEPTYPQQPPTAPPRPVPFSPVQVRSGSLLFPPEPGCGTSRVGCRWSANLGIQQNSLVPRPIRLSGLPVSQVGEKLVEVAEMQLAGSGTASTQHLLEAIVTVQIQFNCSAFKLLIIGSVGPCHV